MLLDKSFFDLSGETCDRIGVAWTAFKYQSEGCERTPGDCVKNQIENFHEEDTARGEENPLYFVKRYCDGLMEGEQVVDDAGYIVDEYFMCPIDQRHTTMVRLELKADQMRFVSNVGKAVIVQVEVKDFEAFSGAGILEASLTSESDFRAEFSLGVRCSSGVTPAPVPAVFLDALEEKRKVEIQVMANSKEEMAGECTLNLLDKKGRLLDTKAASFTVLQTREKSSLGTTRGSINASQMDAYEYGEGECSDVCGFFDLGCHFKYFGACWWNLLLALAAYLAIAVGVWWLITGKCNPLLRMMFPAMRRREEARRAARTKSEREHRKKVSGSSGFDQNKDMQEFFRKMQDLQQQNTLLQMQIAQQSRKSAFGGPPPGGASGGMNMNAFVGHQFASTSVDPTGISKFRGSAGGGAGPGVGVGASEAHWQVQEVGGAPLPQRCHPPTDVNQHAFLGSIPEEVVTKGAMSGKGASGSAQGGRVQVDTQSNDSRATHQSYSNGGNVSGAPLSAAEAVPASDASVAPPGYAGLPQQHPYKVHPSVISVRSTERIVRTMPLPVLPRLWIVADMDDTLVAKRSRSLRDSPCYPHLLKWLRIGAQDKAKAFKTGLLIVTSDDGFRPFRLCWDQWPVDVRERILLAPAEGGSLWCHPEFNAGVAEVATADTTTLRPRWRPWWIPADAPDDFRPAEELPVRCAGYDEVHLPHEALSVAKKLFCRFAASLTLSPPDHENGTEAAGVSGTTSDFEVEVQDAALRAAYVKLRASWKSAAGGEARAQRDLEADDDFFFQPKRFLPRGGPLLWVNQPGPIEKWGADTKAANWSNMFLMGCPRPMNEAVVAEYINKRACGRTRGAEAEKQPHAANLRISAAPRTICLSCANTSKARPVEFLLGRGAQKVVMFGDQPFGNDAALREFGERNPERSAFHSVKDETECAAYLELLLNQLSAQVNSASDNPELFDFDLEQWGKKVETTHRMGMLKVSAGHSKEEAGPFAKLCLVKHRIADVQVYRTQFGSSGTRPTARAVACGIMATQYHHVDDHKAFILPEVPGFKAGRVRKQTKAKPTKLSTYNGEGPLRLRTELAEHSRSTVFLNEGENSSTLHVQPSYDDDDELEERWCRREVAAGRFVGRVVLRAGADPRQSFRVVRVRIGEGPWSGGFALSGFRSGQIRTRDRLARDICDESRTAIIGSGHPKRKFSTRRAENFSCTKKKCRCGDGGLMIRSEGSRLGDLHQQNYDHEHDVVAAAETTTAGLDVMVPTPTFGAGSASLGRRHLAEPTTLFPEAAATDDEHAFPELRGELVELPSHFEHGAYEEHVAIAENGRVHHTKASAVPKHSPGVSVHQHEQQFFNDDYGSFLNRPDHQHEKRKRTTYCSGFQMPAVRGVNFGEHGTVGMNPQPNVQPGGNLMFQLDPLVGEHAQTQSWSPVKLRKGASTTRNFYGAAGGAGQRARRRQMHARQLEEVEEIGGRLELSLRRSFYQTHGGNFSDGEFEPQRTQYHFGLSKKHKAMLGKKKKQMKTLGGFGASYTNNHSPIGGSTFLAGGPQESVEILHHSRSVDFGDLRGPNLGGNWERLAPETLAPEGDDSDFVREDGVVGSSNRDGLSHLPRQRKNAPGGAGASRVHLPNIFEAPGAENEEPASGAAEDGGADSDTETKGTKERDCVPPWARARIELERPDGAPIGSMWANGSMACDDDGSGDGGSATATGGQSGPSGRRGRSVAARSMGTRRSRHSSNSKDRTDAFDELAHSISISTQERSEQSAGGFPPSSTSGGGNIKITISGGERGSSFPREKDAGGRGLGGVHLPDISPRWSPADDQQGGHPRAVGKYKRGSGLPHAAMKPMEFSVPGAADHEQLKMKIDHGGFLHQNSIAGVQSPSVMLFPGVNNGDGFMDETTPGDALLGGKGRTGVMGRSPPKNSSMRVLYPEMLQKHKAAERASGLQFSAAGTCPAGMRGSKRDASADSAGDVFDTGAAADIREVSGMIAKAKHGIDAVAPPVDLLIAGRSAASPATVGGQSASALYNTKEASAVPSGATEEKVATPRERQQLIASILSNAQMSSSSSPPVVIQSAASLAGREQLARRERDRDRDAVAHAERDLPEHKTAEASNILCAFSEVSKSKELEAVNKKGQRVDDDQALQKGRNAAGATNSSEASRNTTASTATWTAITDFAMRSATSHNQSPLEEDRSPRGNANGSRALDPIGQAKPALPHPGDAGVEKVRESSGGPEEQPSPAVHADEGAEPQSPVPVISITAPMIDTAEAEEQQEQPSLQGGRLNNSESLSPEQRARLHSSHMRERGWNRTLQRTDVVANEAVFPDAGKKGNPEMSSSPVTSSKPQVLSKQLLSLPIEMNQVQVHNNSLSRRNSVAGNGEESSRSARVSNAGDNTARRVSVIQIGDAEVESRHLHYAVPVDHEEEMPKTRLGKKEYIEAEVAQIELQHERAKRNAQRGEKVVMLGPERAKVKMMRTMATFLGEFDAKIKAGKQKDSTPLGAMRYYLTYKFKTLKKAFQFFDFNCNGSLAFIELSSGLNMMLPKIWPEVDTFQFLFGATADEVYHMIDDDDSGSVDLKEFMGTTQKQKERLANLGRNGKPKNSSGGGKGGGNGELGGAGDCLDGGDVLDGEDGFEGARGGARRSSSGAGGEFGNGDGGASGENSRNGTAGRGGRSNGTRGSTRNSSRKGGNLGSNGEELYDEEDGYQVLRSRRSDSLGGEDGAGGSTTENEEEGAVMRASSLVRNIGDNAFAYVKVEAGWTGTADPLKTKGEARRRFLEKLGSEGNPVPDGWYLDENGNWVNRDTGETLSDEEFRNRFGDFDRLGFGFSNDGSYAPGIGQTGQDFGPGADDSKLTADEIADGMLQRVFVAACQGQRTRTGEAVMIRRIFPEFLDELDVCDLNASQLNKIFDQQIVLQSQWTYATMSVAIREGLTYEFFKLALHEITRIGRVSFGDFVNAIS
eukprot:g2980.t1